MEITPEERTAQIKSSITMNGDPVTLDEVPETANYRGFLASGQAINLASFLTTIISRDCKVAIPLAIVEIKLELDEKWELRAFATTIATEDVADQLSLGQVIALLGGDIDEKQLPSLQIGIQALSCDLEARQFAIRGQIKTDQGRAEMELALQFPSEGGVELDFAYHSEAKARLTVGELIKSSLPKSFTAMLPAKKDVPENPLLRNLIESGLTDLCFNLNSAEEEFSFLGRGMVLGMQGEIAFSIMRFVDQRMVSFHLYGDEQANLKSIPALLTDTLGMNIPADIKSFLPQMRFALTELSFDQLDESFCLKGVMMQGNVPKGEQAYRLVSSLEVAWQEGVNVVMELDASESPLTLTALANDLPISLDAIKQVIPPAVVEKVGATEFHSLTVEIDTGEAAVNLEGVAKLFGELAITSSFDYSKQQGVKFIATVYADPLPLRRLPALIGIADPGAEAAIVEFIPDFKIGLNQVVLDQQQKLFCLDGSVEIGESRAETHFAVQQHPTKSGVIIALGFVGDAEQPPSFIDLLGAVIPKVDAADIRLPGDLDITLQKLNLKLDTANRNLSGEALGTLSLTGVPIALSAVSKDKDDPWALQVYSQPAQAISLTQVARELLSLAKIELPLGLPEVMISDINLRIVPQTGRFRFAGESGVAIPVTIGKTVLDTKLGLLLERESSKTAMTGMLQGSLSYCDLEFRIRAELGKKKATLTAEAKNLNLSEIVEKLLGTDLPDEVPDLVINSLLLSVDSKQNLHINGRLELAQKEALTLGQSRLALASLEFDFRKTPDAESCYIKVDGNNIILTNEISFTTFDFAFTYASRKKWKWQLEGNVASRLFDREFALQASYFSGKDKQKQFQLSYKNVSATPLLDIPDIAVLEVSRFSLSIASAEGSATWGLDTSGKLMIGDVIDSKGKLRMGYQDEVYQFAFTPTKAKLAIPILIDPASGKTLAKLNIRLGDLKIEYGKKDLSFKSSVALSCPALYDVMPKPIRKIFPEEIEAEFMADANGVSLAVERLLNPVDITLPAVKLSEHEKIRLGVMRLDASDLKLQLSADKVALSLSLGVGLPSELNHNLGVKTVDGKEEPLLNFFSTFDTEKPDESTLRLNFRVGTDGLGVALLDSPFGFINFDEPDSDGKVWCELDFKDCGAVRFQVPEFRLDVASSSFMASGGFDVIEGRELALPVSLIKKVLTGMGLKAAAELLPDTLPLRDVSILDDNDEFQAHELVGMINEALEKLGLDNIPAELEQAIQTMGRLFNDLPNDLRGYFRITIPKSFMFDISVTPDGGVKLKAGVKPGDPPIRILYPTMGPMGIPMLEGLEFHSIAFGEVLSGSLLLLELDVRVDDFDLLAIAAAMLTKDIPAIPLTQPRELQRRIIVEELFMLIVYETGIPIPIPIFFTELGIEYLGLEGTTLQTHVGFPMPKANLAGFGKVLAELISFVRDPEFRLTPDALGEMDPRIVIGANYIQLPDYLGGSVIGTKQGVKLPGVYELMAKILNNLKHFSLVEMISAIPIEYRVGDKRIELGPLSAEAAWLLTTPTEFMQGAFKKLTDSPEQAEDFMAVLPHVSTEVKQLPAPKAQALEIKDAKEEKEEEGLVLFLQGGWGIKNVLNTEAIFGLAASQSLGFHTGFKIHGNVLELLDMEIAGRVAVNKDKPLQEGATVSIAKPSTAGVVFSGANEYVSLPPLDADFSNGITVEAWVCCREIKPGARIMDFGNGEADNNIVLGTDTTGKGLFFGICQGAKLQHLCQENIFAKDTWTHVAVCLEKSGRVRLYKDGVELDIDQSSLPLPPDALREKNFIGKSNWNVDGYFNGELTGLRIWNKAIKPEAIRARMRRRVNGNEAAMVCCWPFAATREAAENKDGHEVILRNRLHLEGPKFKRRAPDPRLSTSGLIFNGKDSYLEIADPFPNPHEFTISLWVNPAKLNDGQYHGLMGKNPGKGEYRKPGLWLAPDKGGLHYDSYTTDGNRFGGVLEDFFVAAGEWVHIGWVKKATEYVFYRNGIEFDVVPAPETVYTNPGRYFIGRVDNFWQGLIDDVQIWDHALGPQAIKSQRKKSLSGYEPGLVAYLPFEEGFGNQTLDLVRREKTRTHATQWQMAEPLQLSGLDFNGKDALLEIPAAAIPTGNEITFSLWAFGADSLPSYNSVIEALDAKGVRVLNIHLPWKNGNIYFDCGNDGTTYDRIVKPAESADYKGTWTHWAFTKNATSGEMIIYKDGQLWHRNEVAAPKRAVLPQTASVKIGAYVNGTRHYAGQIAQISIWDKALPQEQIAGLLQQSLGGTEEGLIAYWPLLEGRGETGFDLISNHNAVIKNAQWHEASRFELLGLQFDGRNDFVDIGAGISMGHHFTIEAWVNGQRGTLLQRGSDSHAKGSLQLGFNSTFQFVDNDGVLQRLEYTGLPLGKWAHLAAVYDGGEMRVHVNGAQVAVLAIDVEMATNTAISLIGKSLDGAQGGHFKGVLDEVRIWNYGRSPQGIKRKMFQRLRGSEAGLIGYWPFLAGKGLRAFDYAAGNNGALHGAQWYVASQLQLVGQYFDGGNFMEVVDPFANDEDFTISLWVNPDRINDGTYHGILGREEQAQGNWYRKPALWLAPNNGGLVYDSYSHAKTRFNGVLDNFFVAPGQWVHIAWVKQGKKYLFYRNGYKFGEQPAPQRIYSSDSGYFIGKVDTGWAGLLDEIRIWDYARDEDAIQADLNRRLTVDVEGLQGYWPLGIKDDQISQALNEKGNANIIGSHDQQSQLYAPSGIEFDGHYDYLDLGGRLPLAGNFTLEAWVNGSGSGIIFQKGADVSDKGHVQLDYNQMFRFVDDNGQTHILHYQGLPDKEWTHIAATCDGRNMKVFINAEEVAARSVSAGVGSSDAVSYVGNRPTLSENSAFKGRVDEIRVWDHARSSDELTCLMHKKLYGTEPGLIAYLPCNEGFGQTAFDQSGQNNAKLHGPKWANLPFVDMQGLAFDGENDWLNCGPIMDPLARPWSVELWFKWDGGGGEQVLYNKGGLFKAAIRDGYFHYLWSPADEWRGGESFAVERGEWTHAAVVYDGTMQSVYMDGMEIFSQAQQGAMGASPDPFIIGADGADSPHAFFNGQIHTLRVWDKALTVAEVLTRRYENLTGTEPKLVGCWKLQPAVDNPLTNRAARNYAHWHGTAPAPTALQPVQTSADIARIEDYFNLEGMNSSFVVAGHCHMRLLDKEVILGDILVQEDLFAFRGELDLFPKASPLQIKGGLRGVITKRKFVFQGDMDVRLFTMTLVGGNVYLSNNGFFLQGILFDQSISLSLVKKADNLIEFNGGLDKALVLGKVFRLCDPLDEKKGPSLLISGPQPPAFMLRGQLELLGIKQAIVIAVEEDNFIAVLDGKIWNLFQCKLTLAGRDLNKLGEFSFEVVFINRLNELVKAVKEEIDRILNWASDELGNARGTVANVRAVVDKGLAAERARLVAEAGQRRNNVLAMKRGLDADLDRLSKKVDGCLRQIAGFQRQLEAESRKFSAQITKARRDINQAQQKVNTILGEIHKTEKWFNKLPFVSWPPWKPSRSKDWIWVGPKIAGLYAAYGTSTAALQSVNAYLAGINALQQKTVGNLRNLLNGVMIAKNAADNSRRKIQQELDTLIKNTPAWVMKPELIVIEVSDKLAGAMFDLADGFLKIAQETVEGIQLMCDTFLRFDEVPLQIKSASFAGKLGSAVGMVFEVNLDVEYRDLLKPQITHTKQLQVIIDFSNLPKSAANLIGQLFLPLAQKQQALIAVKASYEQEIGKAMSGQHSVKAETETA